MSVGVKFVNCIITAVGASLLCLFVYAGITSDKAKTRYWAGTEDLKKRITLLENDINDLRGENKAMLFVMSNLVSTVCAQQYNINDAVDACSNMLNFVELTKYEVTP